MMRREDIGFIKSLITTIQPEGRNCVNTRKQMDFHARNGKREYGIYTLKTAMLKAQHRPA